ncbi:hypothetical protein PM082_007710 [Marasmius tenuissimus]|nr:hypothetical protein PM082_007710 [Marasmius tenuissimus]
MKFAATFKALVFFLALPLFVATVEAMPFDVSQLDSEEFAEGPQPAVLLNKAD